MTELLGKIGTLRPEAATSAPNVDRAGSLLGMLTQMPRGTQCSIHFGADGQVATIQFASSPPVGAGTFTSESPLGSTQQFFDNPTGSRAA